MGLVTDAIFMRSSQTPDHIALSDGSRKLSFGALNERVKQCAEHLQSANIQRLALQAGNGIDWIILDLACLLAKIPLVPIPPFFSQQQITHVFQCAGIDAVIEASPGHRESGLPKGMKLSRCKNDQHDLPEGCAKITFTSGSTGEPKGVCLSEAHLFATANALGEVTGDLGISRHLCLLPLSTLLENVAGVYAPLMQGAMVKVPDLESLGFYGSSSLNPEQFAKSLANQEADSIILIPQMLIALNALCKHGWHPRSPFKFIAVGGGKVAPLLIDEARKNGLPVYEGYGLSECGSVVSLNAPKADSPDTVGKPLSHCTVDIHNGEVIVHGATALGYLGLDGLTPGKAVHTGDLGEWTEEGFLKIIGRKKNLMVSSFGRNIAPEWLESELQRTTLFRQCVAFGDDRPYCSALLVPLPEVTDQQIHSALSELNENLPDYGRIVRWFSTRLIPEDLFTANGRPRREAITDFYTEQIQSLYPGQKHYP